MFAGYFQGVRNINFHGATTVKKEEAIGKIFILNDLYQALENAYVIDKNQNKIKLFDYLDSIN